MKRLFISIFIAILAFVPALAQENEQPDPRALQRRINEVKSEINRLHLLAALDLTPEQAGEIKIVLDGIKLARKLLEQEVLAANREMLAVLEEIRDAMEDGTEPPEELVVKFHELRKKANLAARKYRKKLSEADADINAALTPEQKKRLRNYHGNPLAPPGSEPLEEGEILDEIAKLIDRLKEAPPEQYRRISDHMMRQFMGRFHKNRKGPGPDLNEIRKKLEEISEKARTMDDFEYMLWREEFAQQLYDLVNRPGGGKKRAKKEAKDPFDELEISPAGRVFLEEGMLKSLEKHIAALEKKKTQKAPPEKEEDNQREK